MILSLLEAALAGLQKEGRARQSLSCFKTIAPFLPPCAPYRERIIGYCVARDDQRQWGSKSRPSDRTAPARSLVSACNVRRTNFAWGF